MVAAVSQPVIAALRGAGPYLRLYRGKTFVVRASAEMVDQVAMLHYFGIRIALVVGGAREVERRQLRDWLGESVVGALQALGVEVEEASAGTFVVGELRDALDSGRVVVMCPQLQYHLDCERRVDEDAFAATVASQLGAEKLVFCTGAPGILEWRDDPRSLVSYTDLAGLRQLERAGAFHGSSLPSPAAIRAALKAGVRRVHVISHSVPDSLLVEVFTNEGCGTMIVTDVNGLTPAEMQPMATAS